MDRALGDQQHVGLDSLSPPEREWRLWRGNPYATTNRAVLPSHWEGYTQVLSQTDVQTALRQG